MIKLFNIDAYLETDGQKTCSLRPTGRNSVARGAACQRSAGAGGARCRVGAGACSEVHGSQSPKTPARGLDRARGLRGFDTR